MAVTLYILPHAGGAAYSYASLVRALSPSIEVCCLDFPGHGRRVREPALSDMHSLTEDILRHIQPRPHQPWALFGHSMGALLAHAICHARVQRGASLPLRLFVSGTAAPRARKPLHIANLPRQAFWERVADYGGTPAEILQCPELMEYFEDNLRRDFLIVDQYRPKLERLPVPITLYYARDDLSVQEVESWQQETSREFQVVDFNGGHFFLFEHLAELSRSILVSLQGAEVLCP